MCRAFVLAALAVAASVATAGQTLAMLRVRVTVTDANGRTTPVARHALIISDNPPTREVRRVLTGLDGTVSVRLDPANYTVESDEPLVFQGQAHHWRQTLDVVAGREAALDFTLANAVAEPLPAGAANADTQPSTDIWLLRQQWLDSIVELWTPTAHASGFLVDAAGLIITNQKVVGDATAVEVQLSRSIKVAAIVVEADRQRDIAVIRINPAVMASIAPVPIGCAASRPPPGSSEQEIFALEAPLGRNKRWTPGSMSRTNARLFPVELSLGTGGTGGPVFTTSGELVGLTTPPDEREEPRRGETRVVRIDAACELVAVAAKKANDTPPPSPAHLPVEPEQPAAVDALKEAIKRRAGNLRPYTMSASEFEVAFITPVLNLAGQSQPNRDFSNWSAYVADIPPVLLIRVTPKMAEPFWAKMARGAAYTQGMALPALKRLKSGFERLQAFCDGTEVAPIHPFKLDLRVSETDAVYEGLYAFDPAALGPACKTVTLALYSEKAPARADTLVIDPKVLRQIWQDFELDGRR